MTRVHRCVLTDGDGMDPHVDAADMIVVSFSRREVLSGLTGDAADRLLQLSDRADRVRRCEGRLLVQFEGYDRDAREVTEIPECRSFFQALTRTWPFWLHFLNKDRGSDQIALAICLLMPIRPVARRGVMRGFTVDPHAFSETMCRLFDAMSVLHAQHGWSDAENTALTARIMAALEGGSSGTHR